MDISMPAWMVDSRSEDPGRTWVEEALIAITAYGEAAKRKRSMRGVTLRLVSDRFCGSGNLYWRDTCRNKTAHIMLEANLP